MLAAGTPVLVHNTNPCWSVTEDFLDDVFDRQGPQVMSGVEHNIAAYNRGDHNHALNPAVPDAQALADYFARQNTLPFPYRDTKKGTEIRYDDVTGWVMIRDPGKIHGFGMSKEDFESRVKSGRYEER